ncbi:hypothetical protein A6A06_08130 [Streptomyces sp. CB02923]|nr:hypothetical protein A6A06_08130 [Streptomyces sp. CB02923]
MSSRLVVLFTSQRVTRAVASRSLPLQSYDDTVPGSEPRSTDVSNARRVPEAASRPTMRTGRSLPPTCSQLVYRPL